MAHALFPWEPGPDDPEEDPRDIAWIKVGRRNARGELEWVPRAFAADEIGDLDDVHERWGGGCYTFVARNQRNSAISARANDVLLPGPSKPLVDEPSAPSQAQAQAAPAPPPPPVGLLTQIAAFSAAVGPILTPILSHLAEGRREHQALMLELLARSRSDQEGAARAAIEAAQSNQRVMADFFAKLSPAGGGGGATLEQLMAAIQLGAQMSGGKVPGNDDDFMESLMAMFGPLIQAQAQAGAPPQLPHSPAEQAPELIETEGEPTP